MSELLARLVQQEVPRQEAVPLAAWATGNDEVVKAVQGLNEASGRTDEKVDAVLPPFLHWVLTSELEPEELQNALHVAADTYRFRSNRRVALLRGTLPIVACVVFAGGMTLVYGVTVFLPVVQMLYEMR